MAQGTTGLQRYLQKAANPPGLSAARCGMDCRDAGNKNPHLCPLPPAFPSAPAFLPSSNSGGTALRPFRPLAFSSSPCDCHGLIMLSALPSGRRPVITKVLIREQSAFKSSVERGSATLRAGSHGRLSP